MNLKKINPASQRPLYLQVAESIEEKIVNKELTIGQKLPSLDELHKLFKVGHMTIRSALSELVKKGYILSRQNRGTSVISSEPTRGIDLKRKNEIAVVNCALDMDNLSENTRYRQIMRGVEEKAKEKGIYILNSTVRNGEDMLFLAEKQNDIAGLIVIDAITPKNYRIIKSMNIPFVLIGDLLQEKPTKPEVDVIANDDFQGIYLATKHLIDLGHRRIGYVAYFLRKHSWEIEKTRGYEAALKESGILCDRKLEIEVGKIDSNVLSAKPKLREVMKNSVPFSALICNDVDIYDEAIRVFGEKGLRVPDDVSMVVSSGGNTITSVSYKQRDMGKIAFERLIERLTNSDWKPERIVVPYKLTDNGTTRKIR
jgi:DNA-binding LacI/PurR family transcriptional regulator